MGKKNYKYESESGRNYTITGNHAHGYRATDNQSKGSSVYATETIENMEQHIERVEKGTVIDVKGFGK